MESDSDDDVFNMDAVVLTADEDNDTLSENDILKEAELAVIDTNSARIEQMQRQPSSTSSQTTLALALLLSRGQYADVLRHASVQSWWKSLGNAVERHRPTIKHPCSRITQALEDMFLADPSNMLSMAYTVLYSGAALLNMFVQLNYTGPAMEDSALADLLPMLAVLLDNSSTEVTKDTLNCHSLVSLQVDGESPFSICEYPVFLEAARCLLHFVGLQSKVNWSHSEAEDHITKPTTLTNYLRRPRTLHGMAQPLSPQVTSVLLGLSTGAWWTGRSLMTHQRLLITKEPSNTLWTEAQYCFSVAVARTYPSDTYLSARAHLEWGLAQHVFEILGKGRSSFDDAMAISGLTVQMSGSMGKRTKYQVKSVAQMVLHAKSRVENVAAGSESAVAEAQMTHVDFGGKNRAVPSSTEEEASSGASTEEGDPLSFEDQLVADGEAAYRNITRDQADPDNILLEHVAFEDDSVGAPSNLQVIDQAILLSLCLDVKNNNPADGLTSEQMMPYLTRVLDNPNNWMVYSTGLLERAWLECETQRSRERAILQMQALVDQHTTRLTITQTSLKAIQDAAPAHERMAYIYSLIFPPRYALKRDLAERYLGCGVYASALGIFQELDMWDEIVQCYQLLDQPKRAEALVRQRLEIAPTPLMWCCLGDLTDDVSHYETSWEVSKHRFARAKRTWGRKMFEQGKIHEAIAHFKDAVHVQPMYTQAWFFLGSLSMRTQDWPMAIQSFTHVVQLSPDDGEAWGNLGSIHLRLRHHNEAFNAFQEALKQRRSLWQMWENFLLCAMEVQKYGDAMYAMHQLLDLRDKHKRPVDHEMLAWLVQAIVYPEAQAEADVTHSPPVASDSNYKKQLAKLLGRTTSIVTNNAKVWQVYAHFQDGCGNKAKALECRLKECRALQKAGWETNQQDVELLCRAAKRLSDTYIEDGTKASLHACRMYLRGVHKKAQVDFSDNADVKALEAVLRHIEALEAGPN
ncbi:hypothetical protein DYB32_001421 [Aphanomyces invadans]|uniref:Uncharacterized protein n=1 Tax=Aphanomyces invadans TaxID=157072 RepID=A0A418B6I1_9STRA|nr:hypothetical protein DYB32_001421 [Aphanomyces invadans]